MVLWSQRMLYLGLFFFFAGALLRFCGYSQAQGFLQGLGMIESGITPRAFLMAGGVCGVLSIALGVVGIGKLLETLAQDRKE